MTCATGRARDPRNTYSLPYTAIQRCSRAAPALLSPCAPTFCCWDPMDFVAQPAGTTADAALLNRGADPDLIANADYAFFNACAKLLHVRPVVGNRRSATYSAVLSLVGDFFITVDMGVYAGFTPMQLPTPLALSLLVAFLDGPCSVDFATKDYNTRQEFSPLVRLRRIRHLHEERRRGQRRAA